MFKERREVYVSCASVRGWENFWRLPKCDPVKNRLEPSHNLEVERAAAF